LEITARCQPRRPPSTRISVPVMLVLAAEARNVTTRATSSSVASLRVGVCAAHLAQRGLVHRQADPADRRRNIITLTTAGRAILQDLRGAGDQVEEHLLDGLTTAERTGLHRTLLKLLARADG
jgi:hypothetical protein